MNAQYAKPSFGNAAKAQLNKVSSFFEGRTTIVVSFIIVLFAFLAVILYILRQLKTNGYRKGFSALNDTLNLTKAEGTTIIDGVNLPSQLLGDQYSYSFWLYVDNFVQTPDNNKVIFYRGDKDNVRNANPIVMMDGLSNKLMFAIKTRNSVLASTDPKINYNNLKDIASNNYFFNSDLKIDTPNVNTHLIMTIDSVPFNRWVHYAFSIKDNIVTVFQDGEIYAVKTTDNFIQMKPTEYDLRGQPKKIPLSFDQSQGSLYIGANPLVAGKTTVDGYVSKLNVFNYALTTQDVKGLYNSTPFPRGLYTIGGNRYGIRNPVYKVTA